MFLQQQKGWAYFQEGTVHALHVYEANVQSMSVVDCETIKPYQKAVTNLTCILYPSVAIKMLGSVLQLHIHMYM